MLRPFYEKIGEAQKMFSRIREDATVMQKKVEELSRNDLDLE
jgi:hypothetical protein